MIIGKILQIVGALTALVSFVLAYFKALDDDDVDKEDMVWGKYLAYYPLHTVLIIAGVLLVGFAKLCWP